MRCSVLVYCLLLLSVPLRSEEVLWEEKIQAFFVKSKIPYLNQLRFYTYLYVAQHEASAYPPAIQHVLIDKLIKRFFPDFTDFPDFEADARTEKLATSLLCPYLARLSLEDAGQKKFNTPAWMKKIPASVNQVANWLPWISPLPQPPPPIAKQEQHAWSNQLDTLKLIRQNLTIQQKEIANMWAKHHGKEEEWRRMALRYMQEHQVPLQKMLLVRAVLLKGLYDGIIAEMRAKYTYCVPRPYMMDPSFKPLIRALITPSYPSGHAIEGAICAHILSHYLPENSAMWEESSEEGSASRLYAGVHFPEDVEQGQLLGLQIASKEIKCQAAVVSHSP